MKAEMNLVCLRVVCALDIAEMWEKDGALWNTLTHGFFILKEVIMVST